MSIDDEASADRAGAQSCEQDAAAAFVQRMHGEWSPQDQVDLENRLRDDPAYADAYRRVEQSWSALDATAKTPEFMNYRAEALNYARQVQGERWLPLRTQSQIRWRVAAAIIGTAVVLAAGWQVAPFGIKPGEYRTDIGEQRIIELDDHSRITLDAATRVRVRYSVDARLIELEQGQAQFSVAKNPNRPFKVRAGTQTIVALGTVFTVEYVGDNVHVAMMEGRVAILPQTPVRLSADTYRRAADPASNGRSEGEHTDLAAAMVGIELSAGEEIRIRPTGQTSIVAKADLEAATAWREGKVVLRNERLSEAAQRLNRYSRLRIEVPDPALSDRHVSGVFEAGDTQGFIAAIQRIYPVVADYSDSGTVRISLAP